MQIIFSLNTQFINVMELYIEINLYIISVKIFIKISIKSIHNISLNSTCKLLHFIRILTANFNNLC